ncbi:ubiquitin fusion degradation protein [Aulographum hederae CBS 113979]|uniref:Ubiquitin fusion degradation protein 1 n=1 Tax=Aulographum hederae CBS 113979 TaxID=1176131 RepID=A0A6G1GJP4_9PEZI|nr:ubiquitin fusion degradation protein [Aulographum hederae CBS 113979]
MYTPRFYDEDDPMAMYESAMLQRGGRPPRRFDEYFRCYPVVMLPGPDRPDANHGGKVFLPPSALDKLTRMHIQYPMLFELINGRASKTTHAGVLEFIAEEGKIYLPQWLMKTLVLEPGDLLQVKNTDLPLGTFIKLQPQSTDFLEISDPKAVLERAFRNFSCLTTGDVFTFAYNDAEFSVAVLECKPESSQKAICTLETDLSVDFAAPVGYEEPKYAPRSATGSGTSTPRSIGGRMAGESGTIHSHGTMAQAINYASIAPSATSAAAGAKAVSSHFMSGGHKLNTKKGSKAPTPTASTPVAGTSTNAPNTVSSSTPVRRTNGPQPLRLPPGKLFFGYEVKPVKGKGDKEEGEEKVHFQGQGQTLRKKKGDDKK